jgi:type II secretory pathway pseudopilin PulG
MVMERKNMEALTAGSSGARSSERGFSLIEAIIAMGILTVGALSLAQVFATGMVQVASSSQRVIAREKAREAIESIHGGRDSKTLSWTNIANKASAGDCPAGSTPTSGGVFVTGLQSLHRPGVDGLVNTDDDASAPKESSPGLDNMLGTADDEPLNQFERSVSVCDVAPRLRALVVTVRYRAANRLQTYVLTSYISSYS